MPYPDGTDLHGQIEVLRMQVAALQQGGSGGTVSWGSKRSDSQRFDATTPASPTPDGNGNVFPDVANITSPWYDDVAVDLTAYGGADTHKVIQIKKSGLYEVSLTGLAYTEDNEPWGTVTGGLGMYLDYVRDSENDAGQSDRLTWTVDSNTNSTIAPASTDPVLIALDAGSRLYTQVSWYGDWTDSHPVIFESRTTIKRYASNA